MTTERISRVEERVITVEDEMRANYRELSGEIRRLSDKVDTQFRWTIGMIVTTWTVATATMISGIIAIFTKL